MASVNDIYINRFNGTVWDEFLGKISIDVNGKIGISASSPGAQLEVDSAILTNIGLIVKGAASQTANLTQWQDSSATVLARVTAAGAVGLATTTPLGILHSSTTSAVENVIVANYHSNANGARLNFYKARGTEASPTVLSNGDTLGSIRFTGYDGGAYLLAGKIDCFNSTNDNSPTTNDIRTTLAFYINTTTSPSTPVEVARFNANKGNFGIGTTTNQLSGAAKELMVSAGTSGDNTCGLSLQASRTGSGSAGAFITFFNRGNAAAGIVSITDSATDGYSMSFRTSVSGAAGTSTEYFKVCADGGVTAGACNGVFPTNVGLFVYNKAAADVGLKIQGAASQSANLTQWQDSSATVLASVSSAGLITSTALTTTGGINMSSATFIKYNAVKMAYGQTALGNWFFGNAGNPTLATMTGGNNTAIGDGAFFKLASNTNSVAIGVNAAGNSTAGDGIIAIGRDAGLNATTAGYFIAIGYRALRAATTTGTASVAIGQQALELATPSSSIPSVAIGYYACNAMTTGYANTAVGNTALQANTTGSYNQAFGYQALGTIVGDNNIGIGPIAGGANTSGSNNIYIGANAGQNQTSGSKNLIIGAGISVTSATGSNQLNIGNIIFGTGVSGTGTTIAGLIGIACSAPGAQLEVDATSASTIGLIVKGAASQSANLTEWQNSSATVLASVDASGCFTSAPSARTSGSSSYFKVTTPADTTLAASTEAIGVNFATGTRQWSTGAITTQREHVIAAPTYSFVAASTITNAATLAITSAPIAGTNATIINPYALWVQAGISQFDGNIVVNASNLLMMGGASSSFPALKRSSTTLKVRLADDSADAPVTALTYAVAANGWVGISGSGSRLIFDGTGAGSHGFYDASSNLVCGVTSSSGLFYFASVSSACPALKRSSTTLKVRLADDSADAPITAAAATFSGAVTITTGNLIFSANNIQTDTTTGTKIGTATSQKFSLWNATPIIQPTTAGAAATFVANTSGIANDTATFDGYTIGQVVKALRNFGLLA